MDQISHSEKFTYSFKDVCSKMVTHPSPLIDFVSSKSIDCMGKKVEVMEFCDQMRAADPYYLRGIAHKSSKTVTCQSGRTLKFQYLCETRKEIEAFCKSAQDGCLEVKKKLARRLIVIRARLTQNDLNQKILNCDFDN